MKFANAGRYDEIFADWLWKKRQEEAGRWEKGCERLHILNQCKARRLGGKEWMGVWQRRVRNQPRS
jgi:hypothetical protein